MVGLVGEKAVGILLSRRLGMVVNLVDETLNSGDGGIDLDLFDVTYQVKTGNKPYPTVIVRRINERKRIETHTCDRYIFCSWTVGERWCLVRGWCTREVLRKHGKVSKPRVANAKWWNVELDAKHLESVDSLIRQMKLDRHEAE